MLVLSETAQGVTLFMNPAKSKVLLVDDDPAMLRILSRWLESDGYVVQQAGDGVQALRTIEADCPEFLVTDWEMPNMNGLELCRRVRGLNLSHYIYILFLTVKSTTEEMIAGLEMGADDFLSKPVYQEELLARMRAGSRVVELEQCLRHMARTDPLTGLITQRVFYECLEAEWCRAKRFHFPLSCVMLDLDFFKRINDVHGHPAGDAILKAVAEMLNDNCRGSDSACRYGGEEFCVMLPETSEQEAVFWAERARKRLASLKIPVGDEALRVTGSFGIAQRQDDVQTSEELVDRADQALLCAKQSGRDRVVRYESLSTPNNVDVVRSNQSRSLFHGVTARDVMSPMVACLHQDETVGQAAEYFLRTRINSTPVVDDDGKLVGMLSEKDVMAAMVSLDCWRTQVREVMKPNVIWYAEDTPIQTIYEFLCRVSIRRVVIVKDERPTGAISRGSLLRWFRNLVVNKGLVEGEDFSQNASEEDPHRSRQRLAETAETLAQLASNLKDRFSTDADDLVPYVVGGASQMQGLVNDLLAYSRYANQTTGATSLQALLADGGMTE